MEASLPTPPTNLTLQQPPCSSVTDLNTPLLVNHPPPHRDHSDLQFHSFSPTPLPDHNLLASSIGTSPRADSRLYSRTSSCISSSPSSQHTRDYSNDENTGPFQITTCRPDQLIFNAPCPTPKTPDRAFLLFPSSTPSPCSYKHARTDQFSDCLHSGSQRPKLSHNLASRSAVDALKWVASHNSTSVGHSPIQPLVDPPNSNFIHDISAHSNHPNDSPHHSNTPTHSLKNRPDKTPGVDTACPLFHGLNNSSLAIEFPSFGSKLHPGSARVHSLESSPEGNSLYIQLPCLSPLDAHNQVLGGPPGLRSFADLNTGQVTNANEPGTQNDPVWEGMTSLPFVADTSELSSEGGFVFSLSPALSDLIELSESSFDAMECQGSFLSADSNWHDDQLKFASSENNNPVSDDPTTSSHYMAHSWLIEFAPPRLSQILVNWDENETENLKRRLVVMEMNMDHNAHTLQIKAHPLPASHYDPKIHTCAADGGRTTGTQSTIVLSCIRWPERGNYYVTSVDFIGVLEGTVGHKFSIEEKNRIRRNLETFRPITITKPKLNRMDPPGADFFRQVMQYGDPKPRKIEKDLKVFRWDVFEGAVVKIMSKWSERDSELLFRPADPRISPLPSTPLNPRRRSISSRAARADRSLVASPPPSDPISPDLSCPADLFSIIENEGLCQERLRTETTSTLSTVLGLSSPLCARQRTNTQLSMGLSPSYEEEPVHIPATADTFQVHTGPAKVNPGTLVSSAGPALRSHGLLSNNLMSEPQIDPPLGTPSGFTRNSPVMSDGLGYHGVGPSCPGSVDERFEYTNSFGSVMRRPIGQGEQSLFLDMDLDTSIRSPDTLFDRCIVSPHSLQITSDLFACTPDDAVVMPRSVLSHESLSPVWRMHDIQIPGQCTREASMNTHAELASTTVSSNHVLDPIDLVTSSANHPDTEQSLLNVFGDPCTTQTANVLAPPGHPIPPPINPNDSYLSDDVYQHGPTCTSGGLPLTPVHTPIRPEFNNVTYAADASMHELATSPRPFISQIRNLDGEYTGDSNTGNGVNVVVDQQGNVYALAPNIAVIPAARPWDPHCSSVFASAAASYVPHILQVPANYNPVSLLPTASFNCTSFGMLPHQYPSTPISPSFPSAVNIYQTESTLEYHPSQYPVPMPYTTALPPSIDLMSSFTTTTNSPLVNGVGINNSRDELVWATGPPSDPQLFGVGVLGVDIASTFEAVASAAATTTGVNLE